MTEIVWKINFSSHFKFKVEMKRKIELKVKKEKGNYNIRNISREMKKIIWKSKSKNKQGGTKKEIFGESNGPAT